MASDDGGKIPAPEREAGAVDPRDLERAFSMFNEASARLSGAYEELQSRVERLSRELAVANGELRRQYVEKEALSERLSSILAAMPAGVVVLDGAGCVREANPAARALLGRLEVGAPWDALAARRLEPTAVEQEWTLPGEVGERRLSVVHSSLPSSSPGAIVVLVDITELHGVKRALEHRERLAAMGEMAARLAHQLRTPLATALLYAAHLTREQIGDGDRRRFAARTVARLRHLERLIQDMLLFVRGDGASRERFGVSELLAELAQVMEPQFAERGLALQVRDEAGGAVLDGSRKNLMGALINLLENASAASEAGGRVWLAARRRGEELALEVRDEGRGMDAGALEHIFEPFWTRRPDGTGLGLAIVRGVVEAHDGRVDVQSRPGAGSCFTLYLPLAEEPAP